MKTYVCQERKKKERKKEKNNESFIMITEEREGNHEEAIKTQLRGVKKERKQYIYIYIYIYIYKETKKNRTMVLNQNVIFWLFTTCIICYLQCSFTFTFVARILFILIMHHQTLYSKNYKKSYNVDSLYMTPKLQFLYAI